ncbi:MAG: helix-turn-helix transcriptional regulator [Methyloceanibacter sp.]
MRLIKRPEVEAKTGLSKSAIYDGMSRGIFPKPAKLGPKSVAWVEAEVDAYIAERVAARDSAAA